jgi:phosphoribosyl 1,2-cyclic phosphodiesterase
MAVYICSLNSGSNANCYYIGNGEEAVLIDAGLSCRETEKRMKVSGLLMSAVKAVFVSHEHSDHITGIPSLSKKYQLPVYITHATVNNSRIPIDTHLIKNFSAGRAVSIGALQITAFSKSHDADDPHSFMVSGGGVNISVITDIGYACRQVIKYFKQSDAAFLEANYCADMLENGNYPPYLKRRISSNKGHLSNDQALELFNKHKSDKLRLLILSHLSKNNNSPVLVEKIFRAAAGHTKVIVASRYKASEVFKIEPGTIAKTLSERKAPAKKSQLSLF